MDLLATGVTDASSYKSKRDRRKAVLAMLETFFLLKDCLDDGSALILEAGPDPVAAIQSMDAELRQATIKRWDYVLRKQGVRLQRLQENIFRQDHLAVVAPEIQEQINKAIGDKFDRVTNLAKIGAALVFYVMFPIAETPEEKAEYVTVMAGGKSKAINLPRIRKEVDGLAKALKNYRAVIEKLISAEEIVRLSKRAREATLFTE